MHACRERVENIPVSPTSFDLLLHFYNNNDDDNNNNNVSQPFELHSCLHHTHTHTFTHFHSSLTATFPPTASPHVRHKTFKTYFHAEQKTFQSSRSKFPSPLLSGIMSGLRVVAAAAAAEMKHQDTMDALAASDVQEFEHISPATEEEKRDKTPSTDEHSTAIEEVEGNSVAEKHEKHNSSITVEGEVPITTVEQREETSAGGEREAGELDERIQRLPQELQDWIMDLVIADGLPSGFVEINETYKPPLGLQIDHKSREKFAKKFYKIGVAYQVRRDTSSYAPFTEYSFDHAYKFTGGWLKTLSSSHLGLIPTIRFLAINEQVRTMNAIRRHATETLREEIEFASLVMSSADGIRRGLVEIQANVRLQDEGDVVERLIIRGEE